MYARYLRWQLVLVALGGAACALVALGMHANARASASQTGGAAVAASPPRLACQHPVPHLRFLTDARHVYAGLRESTDTDLARLRHDRQCAPTSSTQQADTQTWRALQRRNTARRRAHARFVLLNEPYYGCVGGGDSGYPHYCDRFAIPAPIVDCESHGVQDADNGLGDTGVMQISNANWRYYGGLRYAPTAARAPLMQQNVVVSRMWRAATRVNGRWSTGHLGAGASEWQCASERSWTAAPTPLPSA